MGRRFVKNVSGRRSLHPHQQAVEERAALLFRDPLDLRVAEAGVQGLAVARRRLLLLRPRLVGARPHAHLEAHLGLVAAVRAGVPESVSEGREGGGGIRDQHPCVSATCAQEQWCFERGPVFSAL